MSKYDFFLAGRWRNKDAIKQVLDLLRMNGYKVYCFIENDYAGEKVEFKMDGDPEAFMAQSEALPQDDPLLRAVFERDMAAEREAENFLLVLPAGIAGHMEAGAAFGMGKKCYAVGSTEKAETLYNVFEQIFPDNTALEAWLQHGKLK